MEARIAQPSTKAGVGQACGLDAAIQDGDQRSDDSTARRVPCPSSVMPKVGLGMSSGVDGSGRDSQATLAP